MNRESVTNTKRAGSSSHKAQNGQRDVNTSAAIAQRKDSQAIKNRQQRLRQLQKRVGDMVAEVECHSDAPPSIDGTASPSDHHVIDVGDVIIPTHQGNIESSSMKAVEAPVQYTYRQERLYVRSAPARKPALMLFYITLVLAIGGCVYSWYGGAFHLYDLIPLVISILYRGVIYCYYASSKGVYDPRSLVADPQNLRAHRGTVVDHTSTGDQMALIGFTSHSEVTICVEVYNHMLSKKTGMKFTERTFQNIWSEAFYVFSRVTEGVDPIDPSVLENTSYVFGQHLMALQMRSKYHLPQVMEAPAPAFRSANWWNLA